MAKQPFVQVGNVVRFRYAGTFQGAPWVNGFHLIYSGPPPQPSDLQTLCVALRTNWLSYWGGLLDTSVKLATTQAWDLSSDTGASAIDNVPEQGQSPAANPPPTSAAVVVSWPVQSRWRGGHFRTYVPFINMSNLTSGRTLLAATQANYQAAAKNWQQAINGIVLNGVAVQLCGVRYFPVGVGVIRTNGKPFPFGIPVVHGRVDTQRRRLGKETP